MSTVTHNPTSAVPERARWADRIFVREMWAALAIAAMWLATLFTAVFAPNIVTSDAGGNTTTIIPSGVAVALFALIGTRIVAKYGFGPRA
jgi:hypothetical protein